VLVGVGAVEERRGLGDFALAIESPRPIRRKQ